MRVQNMTSSKGNKIANQFVISDTIRKDGTLIDRQFLQSYNSIIALIETWPDVGYSGKDKIFLDKTYWDYSVTTGKYRNMFLEETKKETQAKINSGEYQLVDLNL